MSKHAFGQPGSRPAGAAARLDQLLFPAFLREGASPQQIVAIEVITRNVHQYLFFGLAERNGTNEDLFYEALVYLFDVRRDDPSTWPPERVIKTVVREDNKKTTVEQEITDADIRIGCFETHYEFSGMDRLMPVSTFRLWLQRERRRLVELNREQAEEFLRLKQAREGRKARPGWQLKLRLRGGNPLETLIAPKSPEALAAILYTPKRLMKTPTEVQHVALPGPRRIRRRRPKKRGNDAGHYASLFPAGQHCPAGIDSGAGVPVPDGASGQASV
jgi:hypothetical protein